MDTKTYFNRSLRIGLLLYAVIMSVAGTVVMVCLMFFAADYPGLSFAPIYLGVGGFFYGTSAISLFIRAKATKRIGKDEVK
ncbi:MULTISPECIES: hypothetical protein [Priestia]|jgi:hypothetical protein|uniref:hypothetical protein n=1 Tax=Priestia TaxID=2800373 RepID=UPI00203F2D10|nr:MULTISPECIES: hypothetical protein [Priestia]MCM3773364.1 hypothetical protein [Priestia aryabhattai]MDY0942865.1 hypothetical protein [Priestia megaterium]